MWAVMCDAGNEASEVPGDQEDWGSESALRSGSGSGSGRKENNPNSDYSAKMPAIRLRLFFPIENRW